MRANKLTVLEGPASRSCVESEHVLYRKKTNAGGLDKPEVETLARRSFRDAGSFSSESTF
jgi:hypothetical protein